MTLLSGQGSPTTFRCSGWTRSVLPTPGRCCKWKKIFSFRNKPKHVLSVRGNIRPCEPFISQFWNSASVFSNMSVLNSSLNIYIIFPSPDKLTVQIWDTTRAAVSKSWHEVIFDEMQLFRVKLSDQSEDISIATFHKRWFNSGGSPYKLFLKLR